MIMLEINWQCSSCDGKTRNFSFPENGVADLFSVIPPFEGKNKSVSLTGTIELASPVTAVFGVAADSCWLFKVNGEILLDARVSGNSETPVSPDNHPFEIDLDAGKNVFELEIFGKDRAPQTLPVAFKQLADRGKLEFKYQPVILYPDASARAVSVVFAGSVPSPAAVEYRPAGGKTYQRVYNSRGGQILRHLSRHHIRIEDLEPDTRYEYRAILIDDLRQMADAAFSEAGYFRTPDEKGDFTFVATADLQDESRRTEYLERLLGADSPFEMDFFAYLGDVFWTTDCDRTVMDKFIVPFRNITGNTTPLVMVRGNHENYGREWYKYLEYFSMPQPGRDGYGLFKIGDVCFIVLDFGDDAPNIAQPSTRCFHDFKPYIASQRKWLKRMIDTPECRNAKFRIVLAHATPLGDSKEYLPGLVREITEPFFGGKEPLVKIHLYLGGHIHRPFRSIPFKAACFSSCDPRKLASPHPKIGEEYGFTVVTTGGPSRLENMAGFQATSIKVDVNGDRMNVSCFDFDNKEYDRVSIDCDGRVFAEKSREDFRYFEY